MGFNPFQKITNARDETIISYLKGETPYFVPVPEKNLSQRVEMKNVEIEIN